MAGAPASGGSRMMWLYSTLGTLGQNFEYSDSGRMWLVDRVSRADVSSRRDRSASDWWEGDSKLSSSKGTSVHPLHALQRAASLNVSVKVPDLDLNQVLGSPNYRGDFENYLEENLSGSLLPFLETAQDWAKRYTAESERKHTYSLGGTTLSGDPKKLEDLKVESLRIYSEFLGPSASGKLDIDRPTLTTIKRALRIDLAEQKAEDGLFTRTASEYEAHLDDLSALELVERAEATRDHSIAKRALDRMQQFPEDDQESLCERAFAVLTDKFQPKVEEAEPVVEFGADVFAEAIKQAKASLDSVFMAFKASDDYVDMFAPDPISTKSPLSASQSSIAFPSMDKESIDDQDDKLFGFEEEENGRSRCPAWHNTEGWRSLRCEILDVHTKVSNLRALISVDSTTYKTFLADKLLREGLSAEFALSSTSQYLTLSLRSGSKEVGKLELPMGVVATGPQGVETWFTVNQVTKKENLAKMEIKLKLTCRTCDPTPCSLQQVEVEGPKGGLTSIARGLVSKEKRRFQQDGFDLDLSYITDNLIAMGYPSAGAEGVYRNPIEFVQRFFDLRHPQAFLLYNLCAERTYDVKQFQGRVRHFPFEDHNPPAFRMIKTFCEDVRQFLAEHPQHAVSIHCKAGKGRTGTLISCYLMYAGLVLNSEEALDIFSQNRTKNGKGVTIPSQIRYVHYFGKYIHLKRAGKRSPGRTTLILQSVRLRDAEKQASSNVSFTITQAVDELEMVPPRHPTPSEDLSVTYEHEDRSVYDKITKTMEWNLSSKFIAINEDVRFIFYEKTLNGKVKMFQFWINTRMTELAYNADAEPFLSIPKAGCDKICSDTKHKDFSADFRVELTFANTPSCTTKQQELDENFTPRSPPPRSKPVPPTPPGTSKPPPLPSPRRT